MIRTRIAPSPTGFPHIGTIYQVLFDYAFAKKHGGKFVLRIEDTDRTRFVEGAEDVIYKSLDWFGLSEDESPRNPGEYGPYRQSERLDIYKQHVEELIDKGHAYYCFCTKERLDELRAQQQKDGIPPKYDKHCLHNVKNADERIRNGEPYVIRMNVPSGREIVCHDELRGDIVFTSDLVDDQVLIKSDGYPTYHLAVVVDDHLMQISHLVRGEEWISSMPKHVLLYEFFGWEMPKFYHTAILRNPDKSKLSKRHGHTSVQWYKEQGFLPNAILNFLALMGWSHPEEKEIFDLKEFISVMELNDMRAVAPIFNLEKLTWINGEYIRAMKSEQLAEVIYKFVKEYEIGNYPLDLINKITPLVRERIKTLREFDEYARFFIEQPRELSETSPRSAEELELLKKVHDTLLDISEDQWNIDTLNTELQKLAEKEKISFSKFFMLIRLRITGKKITPPINESLVILGKSETLTRLSK